MAHKVYKWTIFDDFHPNAKLFLFILTPTSKASMIAYKYKSVD